MQKQSKPGDLIASFAEIGVDEVPQDSVGDVEAAMITVFKAYPNKHYTQSDFVTALKKSNPRINKALRKLVGDGVITRGSKVGNKYFYQAAPQSV